VKILVFTITRFFRRFSFRMQDLSPIKRISNLNCSEKNSFLYFTGYSTVNPYIHSLSMKENVLFLAAVFMILWDINMSVTINSNRLEGSAEPLCDFFPYYAISAANNSRIMYYGWFLQRRAINFLLYIIIIYIMDIFR